ncbi:GTPase-activating protein GYP7 [Lamellibrachia satsuma]|nr:GTPase-activating protein GYP7 [Lamellibrachia satsuma]
MRSASRSAQTLDARKQCTQLTTTTFEHMFDSDGRLVDEHRLRRAVFSGGVESSIRRRVWLRLFGFFPFHSTTRECDVISAERTIKYNALKKRWREMLLKDGAADKFLHPGYLQSIETPSVEEDVPGTSVENTQHMECMQLPAQLYAARKPTDMKTFYPAIQTIDKDVPRTDRTLEYFSNESGLRHLRLLRDILMTYSAFHPHVGYAQGMNDIAGRFLVVFDSEVEAYWCFKNYMHQVETEFMEESVLRKLEKVHQLLLELDTDLMQYLAFLELSDMAFCHRWMLLNFKREFSLEDSLRCFEILSSHHLEVSSTEACKAQDIERQRHFEQEGGTSRIVEAPLNIEYTFDVFMCVSILMEHRDAIFQCTDAAEVFQFIWSLSTNLNLDDILSRSEVLFYKYCSKSVADCFQMVELPSPSTEPLHPS